MNLDYKFHQEAYLPAKIPSHLNHHPLPRNKTEKAI